MADTVGSIGERALVGRLRARVGAPRAHVHLGIGDDAAALEPERGMLQVVTTDALVEDVHFRRAWTGARAIGHKALAVNLSDLAAMGAVPHSALLSLALPADFPLVDFDDLLDGFLELATREQTTLVGGNLTRSPGPIVVDVTALGAVRRRRLLRRDTALRSDELWVTGAVGGAAAGLACLERGPDRQTLSASQLECVERYERPIPRTRVGRIVARVGAARAAIDLSDGLADAARQLAESSGLGVTIDGAALPLHPGVRDGDRDAAACVSRALSGGEDYELAFAVPVRGRRKFLAAVKRAGDIPVTRVGTFLAEPGIWLDLNGEKTPLGHGFSHF
jgi:thiamine-monophosphate kinase